MKKILFLSFALFAFASDDEWYAKATDKTYIKECAACHMAYQPGLLDKAGWKKMMGGLSTHFGTDASLEPKEQNYITNYLLAHSGRVFNPSVEIAISKTPHFVKEHRKVMAKVSDPKIKSIANCKACHTKADEGYYEDE